MTEEAQPNEDFVMLKTIINSIGTPLIVAAIAGGITLYGSTRAYDEKFVTVKNQLDEMHSQQETLKTDLNIRVGNQWAAIQTLQTKLTETQITSIGAINAANEKQSAKLDDIKTSLDERGEKRDATLMDLAIAVRDLTNRLNFVFAQPGMTAPPPPTGFPGRK